MTAIMEAVVEEGTAKAARIAGYTIAGKTGTARKVAEGRRGYSDDYNASFVGFVPSRDPAFSILVVIDSPKGKGYYGGAVAAPIFKRHRRGRAAVPRRRAERGSDAHRPRARRAQRRAAAPVAPPRRRSRRRRRAPAPRWRSRTCRRARCPTCATSARARRVRRLTRLGLGVRLAGTGVVVAAGHRPGHAHRARAWSCSARARARARGRRRRGPLP